MEVVDKVLQERGLGVKAQKRTNRSRDKGEEVAQVADGEEINAEAQVSESPKSPIINTQKAVESQNSAPINNPPSSLFFE